METIEFICRIVFIGSLILAGIDVLLVWIAFMRRKHRVIFTAILVWLIVIMATSFFVGYNLASDLQFK